jgi:archaellum component FlaF (FlaF/FlaG flagellin family)
MRRMTETVSGVGTSPTLPMDYRAQVFNIGFGCEVTGTVTFSVQHTFDDIYNPAITPVWFNHAVVNGATANTDGNYAFPIAAMRLNVTAGTGSVTINILSTSGQG